MILIYFLLAPSYFPSHIEHIGNGNGVLKRLKFLGIVSEEKTHKKLSHGMARGPLRGYLCNFHWILKIKIKIKIKSGCVGLKSSTWHDV